MTYSNHQPSDPLKSKSYPWFYAQFFTLLIGYSWSRDHVWPIRVHKMFFTNWAHAH